MLIPLIAIYLAAGILFVGLGFLPVLPAALLPWNVPLADRVGDALTLGYRSIAFCLEIFSRLPGLHLSWRPLYLLFLVLLLVPAVIGVGIRRRIPAC